MIKLHDHLSLEIIGLAQGGDGLAKTEGLTLFVPGGIPKDKLKVEIVQLKKGFGFGRIIKVEEPSPFRILPPCPLARPCGACQWQEMDYLYQVRCKEELVRHALETVGRIKSPTVLPCIPAEVPWHYRNKGQFPVGGRKGDLRVGYYQEGTHHLVEVASCALLPPLMDRAVQRLRAILNKYAIEPYQEDSSRGYLRHIIARYSFAEDKLLMALVLKESKNLPLKKVARELMHHVPQVKGVLINLNPRKTNVILGEKTFLVEGKDHLIEKIGHLICSVHLSTFFQVNIPQTEKLYQLILEWACLRGTEKVIDAYAGSGVIALFLAKSAGEVLGIEVNPSSVKDAQWNAKLNGVENCSFQVGAVEKVLPFLLRKGARPDLVVLDPPRKGCQREVVQAIAKSGVQRIIYVSCNPITLARDVKFLTDSGYNMVRVQPVDMFPQTYHVESVALLERR